MAELFGLSKQVFAYHEPRPLLYGLSRLSYMLSDDPAPFRVLQEGFETARRSLLDFSLESGMGYVETSPQVTFLAPVIAAAIPNVLFIHIVRDPRDVVRSGMRRKWFDGNPNDQYRISPEMKTEEYKLWVTYNSFQKNIWLWMETNRWIYRFCARRPAQSLLLRSEDIFGGNQDALTRLYSFLGLAIPPKYRIESLLQKKLNAQRKGQFPEPSKWPEAWNQDLRKIAGETAETFGYGID